MYQFLDEVAREFRLADWRENIAYRNELIRAAALHAIDNGLVNLRALIDELQARAAFREMSRPDRNGFHQRMWYLRRIVEGWQLLDHAAQSEFRAGKIPPSTIAKRAAPAIKALKRKARPVEARS